MKCALAIAVFATGCAARSIDEIAIACTVDDECPDGAWCHIPHKACETNGSPPHLVIDGIAAGSAPLAMSIAVPATRSTEIHFQIHNDGGSQAAVDVTVTGPACLDVTSLISHGELLDPGEPLMDNLLVQPTASCGSPARLSFMATADGRQFAFGCDVTITP